MAATLVEMIDNLRIEDVRAELARVGDRDIVLRSLLRGLLAREREREQERRAEAVEQRLASAAG